MKKFAKLIGLLLIVALVVSGCGGSNEGENEGESTEPVVIRLAHDNSVQSPTHVSFEKFKEIVESESDGQIEVTIFPGGQMGSTQDTLEQTRLGDIQMSAGATTVFTQSIPEFAVWDSFYLFDDHAHAHRVLDSEVGVELMKPLEKSGLTGLGYMEIGFRNFSNSKRPVETVEDLAGLKIRGYNPVQIKAWESTGAILSSVSFNELFTSLQQSLIDGQESAIETYNSNKFYEANKYLSLTEHIYTNFLWYANGDFMDSLSDEHRAIIENAVKETIEFNRDSMAQAEQNLLEELPAKGVEINEVTLDAKKQLGELMNNAVKNDIIASCGQDIYDMVMEEVENQR
ncbi:TRAP transporter substrate-binding protein [Alkalibacter rhizosphaerae]|uniref:TRAP transporter substrate-binding protein n=1 Tax=Alkalibacter rhizosphaerae TaxID=2815577 RepID=A0A975AGT0_9FIRM|nr:TRAP transporter substrate-binding protein [Alkalibacter rhizosphaerae]QSX07702.1 TRAP transporter substrate-binding protein [Alkalibacter rhizosphaerae]